MKNTFADAQIVFALLQAEGDTPVAEIIRKMETSEVTCYRWKNKYAGMGIAELCQLQQFDHENRWLAQLVADLMLDKPMFRDALSNKF